MTTELAIPFQVQIDGRVAIEQNPDRQIGQRVRALVGTAPGERPMRYAVGVPLMNMLFESDDALVYGTLEQSVIDVMSKYEPGAVVKTVTPVQGEDGQVLVEVDYTRTDGPNSPGRIAHNVNTAVISVGGNVTEIVRG